MPNDVVDESRNHRFQPLRLIRIVLDELVEDGERPLMDIDGDLLRLFCFHLGPQTGLGRFELCALRFECFELFPHCGKCRNPALSQDLGQTGELLLDVSKLLLDPFVVLLELPNGLGDKAFLPGRDRAHALGLEVEELQELEDRSVDRFGGNIPLGA